MSIETALEAGVLTVRFSRPEKKNAFTRDMYEDLCHALARANEDKAVRVVLFTGAGDAFTAGNDLLDFMNDPPTSASSPVFRFLTALVELTKPLVAAVNGVAVGVGATMLLHADLVYAAKGARLHFPFINLGLVPEAGSSMLLPAVVGAQKANELLLLGEPFDAQAAQDMGLVLEVLEPEALLPRARARALALAERPAGALAATKRLIRERGRETVKEVMAAEAACFAERLRSPEAMEAFQAFFEKRKPDFSKVSG